MEKRFDTTEVILVDPEDRPRGTMEKLEAHRNGALHRAFSVFVFRPDGRLILQQRAAGKYHSAGLWTNTCCSHPRPGETVETAVHRRLREEMGFDCALEPAFRFLYRAQVGDLIEHELDHVFVGEYAGEPAPDPAEVAAWKAISPRALRADIAANPRRYTVWLYKCLHRVLEFRREGVPNGGGASKVHFL